MLEVIEVLTNNTTRGVDIYGIRTRGVTHQ